MREEVINLGEKAMDKIRYPQRQWTIARQPFSYIPHQIKFHIPKCTCAGEAKGILGIGAKPWIIEAFPKEEGAVEEKPVETVMPSNDVKESGRRKKVEKAEKIEDELSNETVTASENKKENFFKEKKQNNRKSETPEFSRGGYDPIPAPRERREDRRFESNKAINCSS